MTPAHIARAAAAMRHGARAVVLGGALLAGGAAAAQALRLPDVPQAGFSPRLGTRLPLDTPFVSADGRPVTLGDYFGRTPVVVIPGYYTCRTLCETTFQQAAQAVALSGWTGGVRVLGISIDPQEGPANAAPQRAAYTRLLPAGAALDLLTGGAASIARVTQALGYRYSRLPDGQFAHAAALVVATPDGRVSQVFNGVQFAPQALRTAFARAAHGGIAAPAAVATASPRPTRTEGGGWGQQVQLLCAHFDPHLGQFTATAFGAVRVAALLAAAGLGIYIWRRRKA